MITSKDIVSQKKLVPENSVPCISSSQFENIDIDTKNDLIKARLYSKYLKQNKTLFRNTDYYFQSFQKIAINFFLSRLFNIFLNIELSGSYSIILLIVL